MACVKSSLIKFIDNVDNSNTIIQNSININDKNNNTGSRNSLSIHNAKISNNLLLVDSSYHTNNTCLNSNNNIYHKDNNSGTSLIQNMANIDTAMKRLKDMGWYWGSISPEYATKLLDNEQDGSFLVRDSSSEYYIFSMTIKWAGQIHHARIEHSKGQFSFGRGSNPKLVSSTIVDFIEKAIQYSHKGDYSFFLHRDPSMEGPVRFTMIPLSRLRGTNSLKHMCRFAILPYVRRDKISELSIPGCLVDYLNEPFH